MTTVIYAPVGSLAQLVEQLTFNQLVTGSNPVRPTNSSLFSDNGSLAQLVEQLTFNQLVTGSNPVRPTITPTLPISKGFSNV